jgi:1-pyrroline-5-carboxylate dehydrogenase
MSAPAATTGAWPGCRPFGGWKESGSTGKAIGSFHSLQQYLREPSQTIVDRCAQARGRRPAW